MREVMGAFSDARCDTVVGVMGSQMAKTECTFNVLGHRMDEGPRLPALYIGPTQKQVKSISSDRFRKALRSTASLWAKVEQGQRDSIYEKFIAGVRLGFGWAGSATELSSHPAGLVLVDELDRMAADVDGEGDPVTLARARMKNYAGAKLGVFSTPTLEGASPVWDLLDESSLEFWSWRCTHCTEWFTPELSLLTWPQDATFADARAHAAVACPHCGATHATRDRLNLNAGGRYVRHRRLADDETAATPVVLKRYVVDPSPAANRTRGFWISGLCSPWQSFGQLAESYLRAARSRKPERLQAVVNTMFGELWKVEGEAPPWELVMGLRRDYVPRSRPSGVQMLTMGVDVQKRGLYYVVRGWGYNLGSWLIEHGYVVGDTEYDQVWLLLSRHLHQRYDDVPIARAFVDSGYRPGDGERVSEHSVYRFAQREKGLAFATKGHDVLDRPFFARDIDVTLSGRLQRGGLRLWHLNTDYLKSLIYSRLRWPEGEAGEWTLHREADVDYCRQIVSEQLLVTASGARRWLRKGENHYLDAEVNALAAALSLGAEALPTWDDAQAARRARETAPAPAAAQGAGYIQRPSGGYFRR